MSHTEDQLQGQRRAASAPRRPAHAASGAKPAARHAAGGSSAKQTASGGGRHAAGARSGSGRKRARRLSPRARFRRFCRRHRLLLGLVAVAIVAAIVICVLLLHGGSERGAAPSPEATATAEPAVTQAPTAIPTPTPTPEPTATPEPTLSPDEIFELSYPAKYKIISGTMQTNHALGLPEGPKVDDSFFKDTCFVGDSVTLGLRNYVMEMRKKGYPNLLSNASFLCTGSFGVHDALAKVTKDSLHPTYKGKKMTVEEALSKRKIKKVYIMLGMNDVAGVGPAKTVSNMGQFIQRIQEKNPGIQIFIQSATPRMHGLEPGTGTLFKYDIQLYEALLKAKLENVYFVDIAYVMRDDSGRLRGSYCSDPDGKAMHFNGEACKVWIEYLYTHTPPTYEQVHGQEEGEDGTVEFVEAEE